MAYTFAMKLRTAALALVSVVGVAWTGHAVVACVGDDPVPAGDASKPDTDGQVNPGAKAKGAACATAAECGTGQCVDGVCCESACGGACETCNAPGQAGTCAPVAEGQDPANECAPKARPGEDGGLIVEQDAAADAGPSVNVPEGGVASDDTACAGKCDGKRACAYPNATKACGGSFCNTSSDRGRAACDGLGHCAVGLESCNAYSCPAGDTTCKTACTVEADCAAGHYCDGGVCKPRLGNGAVCAAAPQCQTGFCTTNVCCNDACNPADVVGASCTVPGKVGQCTCSACATGACRLWYRDADGDGFGDKNGTVVNGRAMAGCEAGTTPPAAGFVKNNTDCDDTPGAGANVFPGQTRYFTTAVNGSFDYDCSGTVTKETVEDPGGACGVCVYDRLTCSQSTTCTTGAASSHNCGLTKCATGLCCTGSAVTAFRTTVACGASGTAFTCGTCVGKLGSPPSTTATKVQGCR